MNTNTMNEILNKVRTQVTEKFNKVKEIVSTLINYVRKILDKIFAEIKHIAAEVEFSYLELLHNDPLKALSLLAGGAWALIQMYKQTSRNIHRKQDERYRKRQDELNSRRIYIYAQHRYVNLRRPMTALEMVEYEQRTHAGQTQLEALSSMGLLATNR